MANQLAGLNVDVVDTSSAPRGRRDLLFLNPALGPARTAILLLKIALKQNLRTIVYTQSRKLTELITIWFGNESDSFADRISAYRAGLLPQERREIEKRLANGDLLAVISTSALELGIDIGDLDLCLLVGYPGSIISTWQRGGRVGRSGQDSALILIAGEDALDQYFMRNPQDFINRKPEAAVVNPFNKQIMAQHLVCATAELTLRIDEKLLKEENAPEATRGFLLNHLIHELLPPKGDALRWANSDPITGQAAWFDLRVKVEKTTAPRESQPSHPAQKSPVGKGPATVKQKLGT